MPSLNVKELSACTPAVWTKCRKQLKAKLEEKLGGTTGTFFFVFHSDPQKSGTTNLTGKDVFRILPEHVQEKIKRDSLMATERGAARLQGAKV